jgi:DNA invertase Pin-like site-specific DNA recombinase
MTNRAAIYARLSREQGADKAGTIEKQVKDQRAVAERRNLAVAERHVFADDGVSGWSGKLRPGFRGLAEAIKRHEIDFVLVRHMDRFSRRTGETDALLTLTAQHNVTIIAGGTEIDRESAMAKAAAQIGGVLAELESSIKSERVTAAKQERAEQGRHSGGQRPFGYEKDGVTLNPSEAKLYRELVERIISGETLPVIADDWHARGIKNMGGKNPFSTASLRQLVAGGHQAGLRTHHGEIIGMGDWPAIITPEEREKALAALSSRRLHSVAGGPTRRVALLSGLIRCECGAKMRVHAYRDGRRKSTYRCMKEVGACGRMSIQTEHADNCVTERLLVLLRKPSTARTLSKLRKASPDLRKLLADIEKLEAEKDEIAADYAAGRIERREWATLRDGIGERLDAARNQLHAIESAGAIDIEPTQLADTWSELDLGIQRKHLARIIDQVKIFSATSGSKLDANRVKISWLI